MESEPQRNAFAKAGNVALIVLVVVAVVLAYFLYQRVNNSDMSSSGYSQTPGTVPAPAPQGAGTKNNNPPPPVVQLKNLPISQNTPGVGSVEQVGENLRYFFAGTIAEAESVADGTQVTLAKTSGLPVIILPKTKDPASVTLVPAKSPEFHTLSHEALKPGVYIQVLMYYYPTSKTWFLRDIFIPTEKNK